MTDNSKWIWADVDITTNMYCDFYDHFEYNGDKTEILISADSNYALYINGKFVNSGQYADFPHYKVYDRIDISDYCVNGQNSVAITVWYYGASSMCYYIGNAAVRYEINSGNRLVAASDVNTQSRLSATYKSNYQKIITGQLGFSFLYDIKKEDNWRTGDLCGFSDSIIVDQTLPMYERPIDKYEIGECRKASLLKRDENYSLYDLGSEDVGYLSFKINSDTEQRITISYGEHIVDGCVRRLIGSRDFSVEIDIGKGVNEYFNPYRRLGLRYLEVHSEAPVEIEYVGILPVLYKLNKVEKKIDNELRQKIYDVSVRTLELCMHEHYEDCPWREQALYAMDSRNQILCGYYAFKEYRFPRASLLLMSKDNREDGMLCICTPSSENLTIPSFTLEYFTEVYEYSIYSKDLSLAKEVYPKLKEVMQLFIDRVESGIIYNFKEKCHWNFYEWIDGLNGRNGSECDAALNFFMILALKSMHNISQLLGINDDYLSIAENMISKSRELFYDIQSGLYVNGPADDRKTELVNGLAVLSGVATQEQAAFIAEKLASNELISATLSMKCFKYDALLKVSNKYNDYILKDIDVIYKKMLDAGATTFWETELGDKDFHNAGSLCHGWSAMPIYYYNILS